MLEQILKARIPLIRATTRDRMNLLWVLRYYTNMKVAEMKMANSATIPESQCLVAFPDKTKQFLWPSIYKKALEKHSIIIAMNCSVEDPMFDVGEIVTPKDMLTKWFDPMIEQDHIQKDEIPGLVSALGGCTIRETSEFVRLTMARDNSLSRRGLVMTRKAFFSGSRGLTGVDTHQYFYLPDPRLTAFIEQEKPYFLNSTKPFLVPRGLLFDGPPGIGKTEGAKYIAAQWGVPLFRLDVGGTKEKWVGSSQEHMLHGLNLVDHEEPCVLLMDEVEKMFSIHTHDSSGTTTDMLSQALWWLAEHKSRVFVVMTTNNRQRIPPELYREGRIDEVMTFEGLGPVQALQFINALIESYDLEFNTSENEKKFAAELIFDLFGEEPGVKEDSVVAHAAIDTRIRGKIKTWGLLTSVENQAN